MNLQRKPMSSQAVSEFVLKASYPCAAWEIKYPGRGARHLRDGKMYQLIPSLAPLYRSRPPYSQSRTCSSKTNPHRPESLRKSRSKVAEHSDQLSRGGRWRCIHTSCTGRCMVRDPDCSITHLNSPSSRSQRCASLSVARPVCWSHQLRR